MNLASMLASATRSEGAAEGRISYPVYGVVTNANDPDGLGRVRAHWGAMLDNEESDWLSPMWPGAIEAIPAKGDPLVVFFVLGDTSRGMYSWFPQTTTTGRATEAMLLATTFVGLYNDLIAKFNNLQSNYQAFYTFVQGHKHTAFGSVSADLVELLIGATAHNTGLAAAKGKAANGSTPAAIATSRVVLSGRTKVGK